VELSRSDQPEVGELVELYDSVGWSAYTEDPPALAAAIAGSTFVVTARDGGLLVGLARGLSDDVSIFYLQDLLVRPSHQRRGIGRQLLDSCLHRYGHVRQRVLLTDDEDHQHRLYRAAGFEDVASLRNVPVHAFVSYRDVELSRSDLPPPRRT